VENDYLFGLFKFMGFWFLEGVLLLIKLSMSVNDVDAFFFFCYHSLLVMEMKVLDV
jgi:hypothetical protein